MRKGVTLETLLRRHWDDRIIVFAKSVEEVYALSRRFLIPGVTYETPARELAVPAPFADLAEVRRFARHPGVAVRQVEAVAP